MTITLPDDPAREDVLASRPTLWLNTEYRNGSINDAHLPVRPQHVDEAKANWERLAPLLQTCFPELEASAGAIRSDLIELTALREALGCGSEAFGRVLVKADNALPVAGSIKARGGVYEVFLFAEALAIREGILGKQDDIRKLSEKDAKELFSKYTIAVGSTGNLGLSVGVAARAQGVSQAFCKQIAYGHGEPLTS